MGPASATCRRPIAREAWHRAGPGGPTTRCSVDPGSPVRETWEHHGSYWSAGRVLRKPAGHRGSVASMGKLLVT